jgi:clan AA aspartic protease
MITGVVDDLRQAIVQLPVLDADGHQHEVAAIIDTGFTGQLTMPPELVAALALPFQNVGRGLLADGSETIFDMHRSVIVWDGWRRDILVSVADTDPLIGMGLLADHEVTIQAWPGGVVRIVAERRPR